MIRATIMSYSFKWMYVIQRFSCFNLLLPLVCLTKRGNDSLTCSSPCRCYIAFLWCEFSSGWIASNCSKFGPIFSRIPRRRYRRWEGRRAVASRRACAAWRRRLPGPVRAGPRRTGRWTLAGAAARSWASCRLRYPNAKKTCGWTPSRSGISSCQGFASGSEWVMWTLFLCTAVN